MNFEVSEQLIEAVRRHPHLWDAEHEFYRDNEMKPAAWQEIAKKLQMKNAFVAKSKWRNLKDCYNKYKKSRTDIAYKKYKKWPWAAQMKFLDGGRRSGSDSECSMAGEAPVEFVDAADGLANAPIKREPYHRRANEKEECLEENTLTDNFENYTMNYEPQTMDRVDGLFLSYASTFKNLSVESQINIKLQMAQIFAEAETKDLIHTMNSSK